MIIFIVILSLLLVLLLWVLLVPFFLSANSFTNQYKIRLPGIFLLNIYQTDEKWMLKTKIFNIPFDLKNIQKKRKTQAPIKVKRDKQTSRNIPKYQQIKWIKHATLQLRNSIKVKRFYAEIDTGDVITNAYLFPTFSILGINNQNIYINYENKNNIDLKANLQLYKVLFIAINIYLKQKYYSLKDK